MAAKFSRNLVITKDTKASNNEKLDFVVRKTPRWEELPIDRSRFDSILFTDFGEEGWLPK